MNCKRCGCVIPKNQMRGDSFRCPNCGLVYRRKATSAQAKPRSRRSKGKPSSFLQRKLWKLPVWLWLTLLVIFVAYGLIHDGMEKTEKIAAQATPQPVAIAADTQNSEEADGATAQASAVSEAAGWEERFLESEDAVIAYVETALSDYDARNVTLNYWQDQPDLYDVTLDVTVPGADMGVVKEAVRQIQSRTADYTFNYGVSFYDGDGEMIGIVVWGAAQEGVSLFQDEGRQEYQSLEEFLQA